MQYSVYKRIRWKLKAQSWKGQAESWKLEAESKEGRGQSHGRLSLMQEKTCLFSGSGFRFLFPAHCFTALRFPLSAYRFKFPEF
jgi:hypothetical protein